MIDPLGLMSVRKLIDKILGDSPGDILTIGLSGGYILGVGVSFDRIVMPNGKPDWFFTGGGGVTTPGLAFAVDRGKIGEINLVDPACDKLSKTDIEGFSLSTNFDLLIFGVEGAIAPFNTNRKGNIEYPTPLLTGKGGLRLLGVGANLFGNWTWDVGN